MCGCAVNWAMEELGGSDLGLIVSSNQNFVYIYWEKKLYIKFKYGDKSLRVGIKLYYV